MVVENEVFSSVSDTTTEEDHVAHCLMMLSKWEISDKKKYEEYYNSEDSGVEKVIKSSSTKVRGKYRCEACNKLNRSYQALGGHMTSHKKIKVEAAPRLAVETGRDSNTGGGSKGKLHECPFCHKVFASGQALGGHKRSHFMGGGVISANGSTINVKSVESVSRIGKSLNIDLNLPATVDDESQVESSAVLI